MVIYRRIPSIRDRIGLSVEIQIIFGTVWALSDTAYGTSDRLVWLHQYIFLFLDTVILESYSTHSNEIKLNKML